MVRQLVKYKAYPRLWPECTFEHTAQNTLTLCQYKKLFFSTPGEHSSCARWFVNKHLKTTQEILKSKINLASDSMLVPPTVNEGQSGPPRSDFTPS